MSDEATIKQQVAIAERLQLKWLERMEKLLDEGSITSTDMATLAKVLRDSGWTLDATKLPEKLRNKLTSEVSPEELVDPRLKIA